MTHRPALSGLRPLIGLVMLAATFVVPGHRPAHACSCAPPEPRADLAEADAAFVGTAVRADDRRGHVVFEYRVDRVVKGTLGGSVTVRDENPCASAYGPWRREGVLLERDGDRWQSVACTSSSPEELIEAAKPLPRPDGRGRPTFLVGAGLGVVRTLAFDREGRTLAYGNGRGTTRRLDICPGSRRVVELAFNNGLQLAVRDLPSLRIVRSQPVADIRWDDVRRDHVEAVKCRDGDGSDIVLFVLSHPTEEGAESPTFTGRLLSLAAGTPPRMMWTGDASDLAFHQHLSDVLLVTTRPPQSLMWLDMGTGTTRPVTTLNAPASHLTISPEGGRVAMLLGGSYRHDEAAPRLAIVSLADGSVAERSMLGGGGARALVWSSPQLLSVLRISDRYDDRVETYDSALTLQGSWSGWTGFATVAVEGRLYGLGLWGDLSSADPVRGAPTLLRKAIGNSLDALVVVPPPDSTASSADDHGADSDGRSARVFALFALVAVVFGLARARTAGTERPRP